MMKNQTTKGRISSTEVAGNKVRNTGNRQDNRITLVKLKGEKAVNVKAVSKSLKREIMEYYSGDILKTCKALDDICVKINKLEKEKQRLIWIILKDVPKSVSS
jgi:vacuolar-type H+-ATPase subunit I/STV1